MTPYFSRLAQRGGRQSQARDRGRSAVADAGTSTSAGDDGYREHEHTLSVDPVPAHMESGANRFEPEPPAQVARTVSGREASTGTPVPRTGAEVPTLRAEAPAIDPYRNEDDLDATDAHGMEQAVVHQLDSSDQSRRRGRETQVARTVAASAADDTAHDVELRSDRGPREHTGTDQRTIVDGSASRSAWMPEQRSTIRALPTSVEASMTLHAGRGDVAAADAPEAESVDDSIASTAQPRRSRGSTVRAAAPQVSAPEDPRTRRSGHGLQVQIGRIELEVVAPQAKASTMAPQPQSVQPPPAPARKAAFNPHRHYLRGR